MRKLVAAIAFLAVTALPATALAQPRWHRGEEAQVTVYVERTRVGATNWSYVKRAGAQWARSSRIQLVFVKRCPSSYYCVKVYQVRSARNQAGWATLNYDPRTNTAWYGTVHLNTRYLTGAAARRKTACHELGHIVGLDHRRTGKTCMRDGFGTMYGHPTPPTTPTCAGSTPKLRGTPRPRNADPRAPLSPPGRCRDQPSLRPRPGPDATPGRHSAPADGQG